MSWPTQVPRPAALLTTTASPLPASWSCVVLGPGCLFVLSPAAHDPPPELNEEAALKAITGVYKSGLASLKKLVERS